VVTPSRAFLTVAILHIVLVHLSGTFLFGDAALLEILNHAAIGPYESSDCSSGDPLTLRSESLCHGILIIGTSERSSKLELQNSL
jgi:hypothetical protein